MTLENKLNLKNIACIYGIREGYRLMNRRPLFFLLSYIKLIIKLLSLELVIYKLVN